METKKKSLKKSLGKEARQLNANEHFVYDYLSEVDNAYNIVSKDMLPYVYDCSYPKHSITYKQMLDKIYDAKIESGNVDNKDYRLEFEDEQTGKRFMYPCDFYYIPQSVLDNIWSNRKKANRLSNFWAENLECLIDKLENGGLETYYEIDKYAIENKDYSTFKNILYKLIGKKRHWKTYRTSKEVKPLKYYIGTWAANKVISIIKKYMSFYRFDSRCEMAACWGILAAPTSNPQTVVDAWRARGVNVPLPDDTLWMDEYEYGEWQEAQDEIFAESGQSTIGD